MSNSTSGGSGWSRNAGDTAPTTPTPLDPWQATRAETQHTQIRRSEEDYLGDNSEAADIGRPVGDDRRELFVSCDPDLAMEQQFQHRLPEFIALHNIATSASRKLLAGMAAASKQPVKKLVIRRQGYGTELATIQYLDLSTSTGGMLRLYATDAEAETPVRAALAKVLLGYSRLGVVLVGEVPAGGLAAAFEPLRGDVLSRRWHNRQLLLMPLSSAATLLGEGQNLVRGTSVKITTTPTVTRPADAWTYISGTWSRLGGGAAPAATAAASSATSRTVPGALSTARGNGAIDGPRAAAPAVAAPARPVEPPPSRSTAPLPLRPMPPVAPPASASTGNDPLVRYVNRLLELSGMVSCCIFDMAQGHAVAHAGSVPDAEDLSLHGKDLIDAMLSTSRMLGLGHAAPEAAVTLNAHHLVLRPVPRHPGLALHAVLDKTQANLTLARLQIERLDPMLDPKF